MVALALYTLGGALGMRFATQDDAGDSGTAAGAAAMGLAMAAVLSAARAAPFRHHALVADAMEYAKDVAPDDVRVTLEWLEDAGFGITSSRGGRGESFGNVLLQLRRGRVSVSVVRDRGQWMCDLGYDERREGLHVVLTAREQPDEVPMPPVGTLGDPLPEQLPEGVRWQVAVPESVEWLTAGDRRMALAVASARWRAVMKRWWKKS